MDFLIAWLVLGAYIAIIGTEQHRPQENIGLVCLEKWKTAWDWQDEVMHMQADQESDLNLRGSFTSWTSPPGLWDLLLGDCWRHGLEPTCTIPYRMNGLYKNNICPMHQSFIWIWNALLKVIFQNKYATMSSSASYNLMLFGGSAVIFSNW